MTEDADTVTPPENRRSRFAFLLRPAFLAPLTLLVVVVAALLSYRASRLSGIPPIDEFVDREMDGRIEIKEGENAFTYYRQAQRLLPAMLDDDAVGVAVKRLRMPAWETVSPAARNSLELSQAALIEWKRGTAFNQGVRVQPADRVSYDYIGVQESRTMARLVILQVSRCLDEGRSEEAWQWLNALFRFTRHCGSSGPYIDRLVGAAFHAIASRAAIDWAIHESTTTDLIEAALVDLREMFRLTAKNSDSLKAEYFGTTRLLSSAEAVREALSSIENVGIRKLGVPEKLRGSYLFLNAEPEVTELLLRHVLANHLSQCDNPRRQRVFAATEYQLFQPAGSETPPLMDPTILDMQLQRSVLALFLTGSLNYLEAVDRETARQTALELCLTVELFRRKRGSYPKSLDDLVPEMIAEVPRDLYGRTPAERMLMVRREASISEDEPEEKQADSGLALVIYSRGYNELDDGGAVPSKDTGLRIPLTRK